MSAPEKLTAGEARGVAKQLGLLDAEYAHIEEALERVPTRTELAVFAGMWSEHCSYKSTKKWLKTLPTRGERVLAGPGSHAGSVLVHEPWAVAFKIESHNHPSAVEPYQGAATGVGGILRDIIAQGARPCAVMDSLCFGMPDGAKTTMLADGVVAGIAGYGNAFGVPNAGGRTFYDPRYEGNPLVNALAAGLVHKDRMRTAQARGVGNALVYVGAATGRDGILGAAFASEELADDTVADRPHVQVGDPYTGKKLMEACLSFDESMGLVACQDMGACGITCAMFEMAAAGGVGIDVDLDTIPLREPGMSPQEIMLSESQERFMFVVEAARAEAALEHFRSYGVHAVVCGRVVAGNRAKAQSRGKVVVDLPAALVAGGAPETDWPLAASLPPPEPYAPFSEPATLGEVLLELLRDPTIADKTALTAHYDQTVGNRTVRAPHQSEAAVMKLGDSEKGFALTIGSRGDWVGADPYVGVQALLASVMRNLACAGAELVAVTDGINHASPRDPVENKKLAETIRGLGDGLRAIGVPVTGGNCSLYNESPKGPIPPSPMIGGLGVVDDVRRTPVASVATGQALLVLGALDPTPTVSRYGALRTRSFIGSPPRIDLALDKKLATLLVAEARAGRLRAAKDAGAGGLGVAIAKLCLAGGVGARLSLPWVGGRRDWQLFGEPPALVVAACEEPDVPALLAAAERAGVPAARIGGAGGDRLTIADAVDLPLAQLDAAWRVER